MNPLKDKDLPLIHRTYIGKYLVPPTIKLRFYIIAILISVAWTVTATVFIAHAVRPTLVPAWAYNGATFMGWVCLITSALGAITGFLSIILSAYKTPSVKNHPRIRPTEEELRTFHEYLKDKLPRFSSGGIVRWTLKHYNLFISVVLITALAIDGYMALPLMILFLWLSGITFQLIDRGVVASELKKLTPDEVMMMDPVVNETIIEPRENNFHVQVPRPG